MVAVVGVSLAAPPATDVVRLIPAERHQTIAGFGTWLYSGAGLRDWYQKIYYDDLKCSILRVDIVPRFAAPYSDRRYNCPGGAGAPPFPGPDGNNVREYAGPEDYTREWGGSSARIAVMGPDIDRNVKRFDLSHDIPRLGGTMAREGRKRADQLGDFKLLGCMWSPAPWLKLPSGNVYDGANEPLPRKGSRWPFIWIENFSGGILDTSDEPREIFNDGTGPTSALTQMARGLAAYLRGYQNTYGVRFYAVSIQNEPFLEIFYNSCLYRDGDSYLKALLAVRRELDRYSDLKAIKLLGPELTIGQESSFLWFWHGPKDPIVREMFLQFMQKIEANPAAAKALESYGIHGYAADGITYSGVGNSRVWEWVKHGWQAKPHPQVPPNVKGFADFGKACWMTETGGEAGAWIKPAPGFPRDGGFGVALQIQQGLIYGDQSAWLNWQLPIREPGGDHQAFSEAQAATPGYIAMKHFYRAIRPGSVRISATADQLTPSAFINGKDQTLTVVLMNPTDQPIEASLNLPDLDRPITAIEAYRSDKDKLWQKLDLALNAGQTTVAVPGYAIVTLQGRTETQRTIQTK